MYNILKGKSNDRMKYILPEPHENKTSELCRNDPDPMWPYSLLKRKIWNIIDFNRNDLNRNLFHNIKFQTHADLNLTNFLYQTTNIWCHENIFIYKSNNKQVNKSN